MHAFRHTCASLLFAGGYNVKQVSGWLGHADPVFTLRTYVHLLGDGVGDALDLDAELAQGESKVSPDLPGPSGNEPQSALVGSAL